MPNNFGPNWLIDGDAFTKPCFRDEIKEGYP